MESNTQSIPTIVDWKVEVKNRVIEAGLDWDIVNKIITAESGWNPSAIGDQGRSFGLWQINLYNPKGEKVHNITEKCALDIYCSTEYAIKLINSPRSWNHWTAYGNLY